MYYAYTQRNQLKTVHWPDANTLLETRRRMVATGRISDTFKMRANGVTPLLAPIHHEAMDILFAAELDSFTLVEAINILAKDESICGSQIISDNKNRLRLVAIRILDALRATKLISEVPDSNGVFVWRPCDDN